MDSIVELETETELLCAQIGHGISKWFDGTLRRGILVYERGRIDYNTRADSKMILVPIKFDVLHKVVNGSSAARIGFRSILWNPWTNTVDCS